MTVVAGFLYDGGAMLCADTQFSAGSAKMDGMKLGAFEASWGAVLAAFSGNVDFAAGAFQKCEGARELAEVKKNPPGAIAGILETFYRSHVLSQPRLETGDYDYTLLSAIKSNRSNRTQLYISADTVLREVTTFDCSGTGEDLARYLMRFLYKPDADEFYAVSLASYVLSQAKINSQDCGGQSMIYALRDDGQLRSLSSERLVLHTEQVSGWFVSEAQKFMLNHARGDFKRFKNGLTDLAVGAFRIRDLWDHPTSSAQSVLELIKA